MTHDEKPEAGKIEIEFTGGNFMPYEKLISIVAAYQNKEKCEDVETIQSHGGLQTLLD